MVYSIKLSTGVSGGAPSGTIYSFDAADFTFGYSSKDKVRDLPNSTSMMVALGKRSLAYNIRIQYDDVGDFNTDIGTLLDWATNPLYLWLYVTNPSGSPTLVKLGYHGGTAYNYAKTNAMNVSVQVKQNFFEVNIKAVEVDA